MPAHSPEELDRLFAQALNAGDIDALAALYEPQAALSPQPGRLVTGHAAIREALDGLLGMRPKITLEEETLAQVGDIALCTARWRMSAVAADGTPAEYSGQSAEVARRQPDGTWLFVIDLPRGLEL